MFKKLIKHKKLFSQTNQYLEFKGYRNSALLNAEIPGVTIVKNTKDAERVLKVLKSLPDRVHAWDTETIDIEVKEVSPVGNGHVIAAQAFCGPDVDFGNGPRLFIDNFGTNHDTILMFKDYFQDQKYLKSWFNYGFDRHILYNHGINVKGFGGDSMQMGRLIDPSRGPKSYSLAKLTEYYEKKIQDLKQEVVANLRSKDSSSSEGNGSGGSLTQSQQKALGLFEDHLIDQDLKVSMKQLFQTPKILKNGEPGKTWVVILGSFIKR